jgi:hypothetical protein
MAALSGKAGSVAWTTHTSLADNQNIRSWSLDIETDELETTDFSVAQWKTFIAGLSGASGTFEGFIDDTTALTVTELYGAAATITLALDGSRTITASAFCTGASLGATVDGVSTYSANFRITGAPAFN